MLAKEFHDLEFYQSIFVLGLPEHQRYLLFQEILHESLRSQMAVGYMASDINTTYILFNCQDAICYTETHSDHELKYLAVLPGTIPPGFVFIIPPPLNTRCFIDLKGTNPFLIKDGVFLKNYHGFIWLDAFPYGEQMNRDILDGLKEWLISQRIPYNPQLLLVGSPMKGSTDLESSNNDLCKTYTAEEISTSKKQYCTKLTPLILKGLVSNKKSLLNTYELSLNRSYKELTIAVNEKNTLMKEYSWFYLDEVEDELVDPKELDELFRMGNWVTGEATGLKKIKSFLDKKIQCFKEKIKLEIPNMFSSQKQLNSLGFALEIEDELSSCLMTLEYEFFLVLEGVALPKNTNFESMTELEFIQVMKVPKDSLRRHIINFFKNTLPDKFFQHLNKKIHKDKIRKPYE